MPTRILIVITGLQVGGAETMLFQLLTRWSAALAPIVVSLTDVGRLGDELRRRGVRVEALGMNTTGFLPGLLKLYRLCRDEKPRAVFTWLYHADLVGGLVARLAGCRTIVWNVRNTVIPWGAARWHVHVAARLCAMLSWWLPRKILCCSTRAAAAHGKIGYRRQLFQILPNGFDADRFRPDPHARRNLCRELGIPDHCFVVGRIARFDPQKDYASFLAAAARLHSLLPDSRFVLVGKGVDGENSEICADIERLGLGGVVFLLGHRDDMPALIAGLDLMVSSSIAEAFPNILGEAMAAGVPCVATDVGDSAELLGECGTIVPPGEPAALAEACLEMLRCDRGVLRDLGMRARARVSERYDLSEIARRYEMLLLDVARGGADRWT
ncbi:MAG TPA: glycosyltransferase [Rhodocyclaceae bacterium]|nr:glycosyltransferase [Rhodocyclaceae bacterium]